MPLHTDEMDASTHAEQMKAAIEDEDLLKIRALVREGFDLTTPLFATGGHAALHHAVNMGSLDALSLIVEMGADINSRLDAGATALHLAGFHGRPNILEFLIKAGADVHAVDKEGCGVLHWWSTGSPSLATCSILLEAGCDPNAFDAKYTPVLSKNVTSTARCVKLIAGGARTSFVPAGAPASYLTPFQQMVRTGSVELVEYLVENDYESIVQRTLDGRTLVELAESNGLRMRNWLMSISAVRSVRDSLSTNPEEQISSAPLRKSRSAPML